MTTPSTFSDISRSAMPQPTPPPPRPQSTQFDSEALSRLDDWLAEQVSSQRIAGGCIGVMHKDETHVTTAGQLHLDSGIAVKRDTIFRIYSMTKPVTSVAVMMLYERGLLQLDDALAKYIPAFENMQVAVGGSYPDLVLEPAKSPITIHQLLTHTSGLTYWFMPDELGVHKAYTEAKIDFSRLTAADDVRERGSLKDIVERLATLPLVSHPGTKWRYSNATDVLGYLIEVVSGKSLPTFFETEIFQPLGMSDTAFYVREDKRARFATCYTVPGGNGGTLDVTTGFRKEGGLVPMALDECYHTPPDVPDGGGGLVSTLDDYLLFCGMLLEKGALPKAAYERNGVWRSMQPAPKYGDASPFRKYRLLGRKTVEFMLRNQLQGDVADYGMPVFLNLSWSGIGFGLGFSVIVDSAKTKSVCSEGECGWGGMASTTFWVDPTEKTACVFLTQLVPSSAYPFRRQLRAMVNAALM